MFDNTKYDEQREGALKGVDTAVLDNLTEIIGLFVSMKIRDYIDTGYCIRAFEGCKGAKDPGICREFCEKGDSLNCGYK